LAYHDEGHEEYLYHIGQEEPEDECGIGIESHGCGGEHIPAEPGEGPCENNKKETHGTDVICDPHGGFVEPGEVLIVLDIDISDGLEFFL
jgi:hypothetical protein